MEISSLFSFFLLIFVALVQTDFAGANSISAFGGIFERGAGEFKHGRETPIEAKECPDISSISPCTCVWYYGLKIACSGSEVTQKTIENTFSEIRRFNGIPEERGVEIREFSLFQTELTQLDLAPFYQSGMDILFVQQNNALTQFVTSGIGGDHGSIHINRFSLFSSPLNKTGFGDTLKYFSNEMIEISASTLPLFLINNDNDNDNNKIDEGEILPGISTLGNLRELRLHKCNISGRLNSDLWNFKGLQSLSSISLYDNNINEIGENVFDFDSDQVSDENDYLFIFLNANKLTESSFHPNSGIARASRPTQLDLHSNQIATLPFEIFQPFLDAHPQNLLHLDQNPLICDERLSWLKSRRDEFESRVSLANCQNDPGHTVFDSILIP